MAKEDVNMPMRFDMVTGKYVPDMERLKQVMEEVIEGENHGED